MLISPFSLTGIAGLFICCFLKILMEILFFWQHLMSLCEQAQAVGADGLSCSVACGAFLDQGWNPCPLHWQMRSYPLWRQGRPCSKPLMN